MSEEPLLRDWTLRAEAVSAAPSKTYTPAFGTGLLARATDHRADALSLKVESSQNAYSARTLCHSVLVPFSVDNGINLRATGREPLNNQPFFRYDRIDEMERIHKRSREAHGHLVESLRAANSLTSEQALLALAAFLRHRKKMSPSPLVELLQDVVDFEQLLRASDIFLTENPEGGKRAQAFVAAVFDCVFEETTSIRVNDPSRNQPGDVHGWAEGSLVTSAEVRAKPVSRQEVIQFSRAANDAGVDRCLIAALDPIQPNLNAQELRDAAWKESKAYVHIVTSAGQLLTEAFAWSTQPFQNLLIRLPSLVLERLREIEVDAQTEDRWRELCGK